MKENTYNIEKIKLLLTPLFESYDVKKAVIFGSYSKGKETPESDIDILVDSSLKGLEFVGLLEDIREAVQKDVDLFDVTHIDKNSKIDQEIKKYGVTIYKK